MQSQNFYDDLMSFLAAPPFNIDSYEISFVRSLASRCNISALDAFRTDPQLREWFSRSNILNRAYTSEKEIFLRKVVMCIDQDAQTCFTLVHDGGGDLLLHVFRTDCLSNLFRRSGKFRTTPRSHRKHGHDSLLYNNDCWNSCWNNPTNFDRSAKMIRPS